MNITNALLGALPSRLRLWAQPFRPVVAMLLLLILAPSAAFAGSATWQTNPVSGNWNRAANWTPATVPNGNRSGDTATFGASNQTALFISARTEVDGIVFNAGASAFTITTPLQPLQITGAGITNNSGITQNFSGPGTISFAFDASAGSSTNFSTDTGTIEFDGGSTAGDSTLIANGGAIVFSQFSRGGTARVEVFGKGRLDHSFNSFIDVTIGSIEGDGNVFLGHRPLSVGRNNLNTSFSGVIRDGGFGGGTGGSLIKIGRGKLVLSHANTYTGGTTVKRGKLIINNRKGSGTGSGLVQVNAGKLGGRGIISGLVNVGTGSGSGAVLAPGFETTVNPGSLTIQSALTFNSDATYKVQLNSTTSKADKVSAHGVTINGAAQFTFTDLGKSPLPNGTVFAVIDNTAATPIAGTFSNLPDGSTFTSNGNTYQANYEGGDGNDLTLTVVP